MGLRLETTTPARAERRDMIVWGALILAFALGVLLPWDSLPWNQAPALPTAPAGCEVFEDGSARCADSTFVYDDEVRRLWEIDTATDR